MTQLEQVRFCGNSFNIIVQLRPEPDILRVIPCEREMLERLAHAIGEIHTDTNAYALGLTPERFSACVNELLEFFGLMVALSSDMRVSLRNCEALLRLLALGLVSYSGSHASVLLHDYPEVDSSVFKIALDNGNGDRVIIELQAVALACLQEYIGSPVWAFMLYEQPPYGTTKKVLLTSIQCFTDLWGPTLIKYTDAERSLVSRIEVEKGMIASDGQGSTDENTTSCHWYKWDGRVPLNPAPFREDSMLKIGTVLPDSDLSDLTINLSCTTEGRSSVGFLHCLRRLTLGTISWRWDLDTISFSAGVTKIFTGNVGGQFKRRKGQSRKAMLLLEWGDANPNPTTLQARMSRDQCMHWQCQTCSFVGAFPLARRQRVRKMCFAKPVAK